MSLMQKNAVVVGLACLALLLGGCSGTEPNSPSTAPLSESPAENAEQSYGEREIENTSSGQVCAAIETAVSEDFFGAETGANPLSGTGYFGCRVGTSQKQTTDTGEFHSNAVEVMAISNLSRETLIERVEGAEHCSSDVLSTTTVFLGDTADVVWCERARYGLVSAWSEVPLSDKNLRVHIKLWRALDDGAFTLDSARDLFDAIYVAMRTETPGA